MSSVTIGFKDRSYDMRFLEKDKKKYEYKNYFI